METVAKKSLNGAVVADLIDVRFAYSGKIVSVRKKRGETVKKWEGIASLDRKILQTELDRQLADYEKARARFEIFNIKNQGGDDTTKFLRQEAQAELNASVKEVELAKYKLDQADLTSPVGGTIVDLGGLVVGLNVTPSGNPVKILDSESLRFRFVIDQDDLKEFLEPQKVSVAIGKKDLTVTTIVPVLGRDGQFEIDAVVDDVTGLLPGMKGEVVRR